MSVDLAKYYDRLAAAFPGGFGTWMQAHYESVVPKDRTQRPYIACRRCGMAVYGLTKHAHNYHGDDIQVMSIPSKEGFSDDWGRPLRTDNRTPAS